MPDFTFEIKQQCGAPKNFNIGGYHQSGIGTEHPTCTCKGFRYRRHCKHIEQAQEQRCPYHEMIDGPPDEDGVCPLCGHPTEYVKVAV